MINNDIRYTVYISLSLFPLQQLWIYRVYHINHLVKHIAASVMPSLHANGSRRIDGDFMYVPTRVFTWNCHINACMCQCQRVYVHTNDCACTASPIYSWHLLSQSNLILAQMSSFVVTLLLFLWVTATLRIPDWITGAMNRGCGFSFRTSGLFFCIFW